MDDFLLRGENGTFVRLRDVGHAEDSQAIQTNVVRIDGRPEVYVPIYRQPGANSLQVVDDVRSSLARLESTLQGYTLKIVADQSIFIRKAIESISQEALIGGGLAALMVLFFLGSLRATFAVMLALPLSLVVAFAVLKITGQTLNVMTLGGLALSVGVLVDNAIVVIEVIMQKRALGATARQASLLGAQEVAMPVLASTLATLIVFFPVFFLDGVVKVLFSALSVAVIASMVASYFAAMAVIPLFTTHFLETGSIASTGLLGAFQRLVEKVTAAYGRSLAWVLRRRNQVLPSAEPSATVGDFTSLTYRRAPHWPYRLGTFSPRGCR
jgi:multidrug efflux pump subunit AcrB